MNSIDLTGEDLSKVPLSNVLFGDVVGLFIFIAVVAAVGALIGLSAMSWGSSPARHQPSASTSLNSDPQPSPYSRRAF
jgi:hypothetical protein